MPQRGHTRPPKTQILYLLTFSLVSGLACAKEEKLTLDPESKADSSVIEVTARHGVENAKEVPFGISVLDGYELQSRRLYSLDSALRSIPGVDINSWGSTTDANIRIRGVGSLYQVSMDDNSVVLNIDGVSMSSRYLSLGTLDVKQIEVLKGPQGTLYGRSSSAGLSMSLATNPPTILKATSWPNMVRTTSTLRRRCSAVRWRIRLVHVLRCATGVQKAG